MGSCICTIHCSNNVVLLYVIRSKFDSVLYTTTISTIYKTLKLLITTFYHCRLTIIEGTLSKGNLTWNGRSSHIWGKGLLKILCYWYSYPSPFLWRAILDLQKKLKTLKEGLKSMDKLPLEGSGLYLRGEMRRGPNKLIEMSHGQATKVLTPQSVRSHFREQHGQTSGENSLVCQK